MSKKVKDKRKLKNFILEYTHNAHAMIGLCLLILIILIAIFADVIAPYSPTEFLDDALLKPSSQYLLGTDHLGRDMFSRIIHGTRVSLMIGVVAAAISGITGTLVGAIAGYYGGRIDRILSQIIDIFIMVPTFFLIILVVAIFGSSIFNVMPVIGFTSWPGNARVMRSQAMSLRERTFVKGARTIGTSESKILFSCVIPNGIFPVISNTTMQIATAILTEASLSFLGLGDPNAISWGQMIFNGRNVMTTAWWVATFPGIAIIITVATFYMIGDGLNTVLNPKLRR